MVTQSSKKTGHTKLAEKISWFRLQVNQSCDGHDVHNHRLLLMMDITITKFPSDGFCVDAPGRVPMQAGRAAGISGQKPG